MSDHPSHKTRISDSSFYDEVCVYCGATDGRGDDRLTKPCPKAPMTKPEIDAEGLVFEFDRYINGVLMAEGVTIERATTLEKAMLKAAKIASRGPNGEVPVLVLRAATRISEAAEPVAWRPTYAQIIDLVEACRVRRDKSGESSRMMSKWISEGLNSLYAAPHPSPVSEEVTETIIETALCAAYARGYEWRGENPSAETYLPKAAADYADKVMHDREGPLFNVRASLRSPKP